VGLALGLLAYNLGNLWRRLALPRRIKNPSLTSLQQRLVKTGGRLVKHVRYYMRKCFRQIQHVRPGILNAHRGSSTKRSRSSCSSLSVRLKYKEQFEL
jgi:hypothetical protein